MKHSELYKLNARELKQAYTERRINYGDLLAWIVHSHNGVQARVSIENGNITIIETIVTEIKVHTEH